MHGCLEVRDHAGGGGEWRGRRAEASAAAAGGGGGAASPGSRRGASPLGGHAVRAAARGRGHGDAAAAPDGAGAASVRSRALRAVPRRRAAAGGARGGGGAGLSRAASAGRARGEQDHLGRRPPLLDGRKLPPQLLRLHRRGEHHGFVRERARPESSDLGHGRDVPEPAPQENKENKVSFFHSPMNLSFVDVTSLCECDTHEGVKVCVSAN